MIIFGTRQRSRDLESGEFYCPRCGAQRQYTRKSVRPYFTLYFVPVFPVGQGAELVQCETCGAGFEVSVLEAKPPVRKRDLAEMINAVGADLESGRPVEFVIRDLTAAGVDWDAARSMVEPHLGSAYKLCEACGLTYAASINQCAACEGELAQAESRSGGQRG